LLRQKLDDALATWPVHHPATKRRFSNEQKAAVIRRACQPGTNVAELAREVDIPAPTIHTWLRSRRDSAKDTLPLAA
jgi:transposase-like protein